MLLSRSFKFRSALFLWNKGYTRLTLTAAWRLVPYSFPSFPGLNPSPSVQIMHFELAMLDRNLRCHGLAHSRSFLSRLLLHVISGGVVFFSSCVTQTLSISLKRCMFLRYRTLPKDTGECSDAFQSTMITYLLFWLGSLFLFPAEVLAIVCVTFKSDINSNTKWVY